MNDPTPEQLMRDLCAYGFSATMDGQRIDLNDIYLTAEDAPMTDEQLAALDAAATQGVWETGQCMEGNYLYAGGHHIACISSPEDDGRGGDNFILGQSPAVANAQLCAALVNAYRAGQLVVHTEPSEVDVDRVARAIKRSYAEQCDAVPLLGNADSGDWFASGTKVIDLSECARAAIAAMVR